MSNQNKTIIIRDDDCSFFTQPEQLEKIYGKLWEQQIPVALAVIPMQSGNVRVQHRPNQPYDPSIPPQYRGSNQNYSILNNPTLVDFLNEKVEQKLVEICLHGCTHSYMEFVSENHVELDQKMNDGLALLQQAFPRANIQTFIAPYDYISPIAFEIVQQYDLSICTNSENLIKIANVPSLQSYQKASLLNGRTLFTCDEYLYTHRDDPQASLQNAQDRLQSENLLIIANHYWTFFYDWQDVNSKMLQSWEQFLDYALQLDTVNFVTFNNL